MADLIRGGICRRYLIIFIKKSVSQKNNFDSENRM